MSWGCDTLQKCIIFIVVPLKVDVSSSMSLPHIGACKLVWYPTWCHFLHPDDVHNDTMNTKIKNPNFHGKFAHSAMHVIFQQWLYKLNKLLRNVGLSCTLVILGNILKASIHSVTFWCGNTLPYTFCTQCQQFFALQPCAVSVLIQEFSSNFINMY